MAGNAELALVTGANGYVATEVVFALLDAGFAVRGTCRSQAKADEWSKWNPHARIEWTIVENIEADGAFDQAVKGVSRIAHVASPYHYNATSDPVTLMLQPALNGTLSILKSAKREPSVKHVVITSSFAAIRNLPLLEREPDHNFTEADWNPTTWDEASKMTDPKQGLALYAASKGIAEHGAWTWLEENKPHFALTCLNPPIIYGPPHQPIESLDKLNTSVANLWRLVDAKEIGPTALPPYVDVRDLAKAHVLALTKDEAAGQRFVIALWDNAVRMASAALPEQAKRFPKPDLERGSGIRYTYDASKAKQVLGMTCRSEEETIVDTYKRLFELEKQLGGATKA